MKIDWMAAAAAALVAIAAVLVAAAPRRWLGRVMLLWVGSPIFAYVGVIAWATLTRPSDGHPIATAFYGFMIISPLLTLPWLVICLVAFSIGFGIRWLVWPRSRSTVPPPASAAIPGLHALRPATSRTAGTEPPAPWAAPLPPARPGRPEGAIGPGWRAVHVGFENDGLRIGAVSVWEHAWRAAGVPRVHLPHPAYPHQMHWFTVYDIGEGSRPVRFAVDELSNGVWGFYVPDTHPVASRGTSADGSLRWEHRLGEYANGHFDCVADWAVLIDADTDRVIVDCEAWESSRIAANADGSLFLHLADASFATLFRIDPVARRFRNHGENGEDRPLHDLAHAVEQAHQATAVNAPVPVQRRISPDGTVRVDLAATEWANSHWVHSPRVVDIGGRCTVLDLWGTDWDAVVSFPGPGRIRLALRRYRRQGTLEAELDLAQATYQIVSEPGHDGTRPAAPLSGVANGIEAASDRADAFVALASGGVVVPASRVGPHPFAAWRSALVILAGAIAAIAAGAVLLPAANPPETFRLTPLPVMPKFEPSTSQPGRQ